MAVGRLKALVCVSGFACHHALQPLVVQLLAGGRLVLVALDHQSGGPAPEDRQALDDLRERSSGFDYRRLRPRVGLWRTLAGATSRTLDYLYLLEPAHGGAESRRERAREAAPRVARVLQSVPPFRWTFGRRVLTLALCGVEAGIPAPRGVRALLSEGTPDLVVVAPSAAFSSGHRDWIRSAEAAGIPWAVVFETQEELAYARGLPRGHAVVVADETGALGGADTLEAVEGAASAPVETGHRGRIARPLLLLLSPFIALTLVLFRPRASARALVKAIRRMSARARKRARARRRQRDQRAKARARAQKAERAARAEAAREDKAKRARLKEEAERMQTAESQASAGPSNAPSQPRG